MKSPGKQTPRITDLKLQIKNLSEQLSYSQQELKSVTTYKNKTVKALMTLEVDKSNLQKHVIDITALLDERSK